MLFYFGCFFFVAHDGFGFCDGFFAGCGGGQSRFALTDFGEEGLFFEFLVFGSENIEEFFVVLDFIGHLVGGELGFLHLGGRIGAGLVELRADFLELIPLDFSLLLISLDE